jgi:hypothetical protein
VLQLRKPEDVEKIKDAVKNSFSKAQTLRRLGVVVAGGNYATLDKWISQLNLDTSHWTGKGHLRGRTHNWSKKKPLSDYLIDGTWLCTSSIKKRLIKELVLLEKCAECGLEKYWNNKPLTLQLDHVNGKRNDNRIENLRLLCPNCHSQTATFCSKNKKAVHKITGFYGPIQESKEDERKRLVKPPIIHKKLPKPLCKICQNECKSLNAVYCSPKCYFSNPRNKDDREHTRKVPRPSKEELEKMVWSKSMIKLGKELGVRDNTIRKWCKRYKILTPPAGHWILRNEKEI